MRTLSVIILVSIIVGVLIAVIIFMQLIPDNNISSINPKDYGRSCKVHDLTCDGVVGIDCDSAADGPYYYVDEKTGEILSSCGGACRTSDEEQIEICETKCPAEEWNCKLKWNW